MLLILILYALFASSVVSSRIILHTGYAQPIFLVGIRMFISGTLLLSYQYLHPSQHFKFKKKHIWYYIQLILFSVVVTYILRMWGLKSVPAYKTTFLHNLSPFITSLYSYFAFKEIMTKKQWFGLLIGLIGIVPILLTTSSAEQMLGEFFYISWPEIAIIASVAAHSYGWVIMRKMIREKSYSPMMVNGISMTFGGLISLFISIPVEGIAPVSSPLNFALLLGFIIIVSNIICHNLYGHLLRSYSATFLAFAGFLTPPFAAFYEWFLFNQTITWHFYLSSIIVFAGLFLFYKDELYQQQLTESET